MLMEVGFFEYRPAEKRINRTGPLRSGFELSVFCSRRHSRGVSCRLTQSTPVPCFLCHVTAVAANLHALHRVFSSIHLKPQFQYLADTTIVFMFSSHNRK